MKSHYLAGWTLVGLFLAMIALDSLRPPAAQKPGVLQSAPQKAEPLNEETRRLVQARIEQRLTAVAQHLEKQIAEQLCTVDAFFTEAKKNTPHFAEVALGLESKWRLLRDHLPFASGDGHQRFLREKFEELVLSAQELDALLRQSILSYQARLQALENQLLVDLQADIGDLARSLPAAVGDRALLEQAVVQALAHAQGRIAQDLQADVGRELASLLAGEILARVALRLGVSSGILGAGAASGWATFGVGLGAGLVVDQLVGMVWDWWADPRGALAKELGAKLDELRHAVVEGFADQPGLRQELHNYGKARMQQWREALQTLLPGGLP